LTTVHPDKRAPLNSTVLSAGTVITALKCRPLHFQFPIALGVVYLVVGILGFVVPMMFGLLPDGYTIFDNLLHLALGIVGIAVALASRPGTTAEAR
jgi:hypothetical protein